MARQPVVYILASPNHRALYIGITTDMGRRLDEHRQGLSEHTSRCMKQRHKRSNVRSRSRSGGATKKIALIESANPEWLDLSNEIL